MDSQPQASAGALAPSALQGVRVVEMGQLIAGPFCGKTLGEFGADVVKIEAPGGGDPLRNWRLIQDGTSVWWQVQSRNKRSLALDLRQPEGQDIARQLIAEADVLIENFRPGTLEGWGMSPEALHRAQPGPGDAAHLGLRPDRSLPRPAGLWRHRRGHGRPAPPHRRAGPRAGARGRVDRRHAGRAARHHRRAHGALPPQGQRRPGPGDRRGAARGGVQRDGEPDPRVQRLWRGARGRGQRAAGHRAVQRLPAAATAGC